MSDSQTLTQQPFFYIGLLRSAHQWCSSAATTDGLQSIDHISYAQQLDVVQLIQYNSKCLSSYAKQVLNLL